MIDELRIYTIQPGQLDEWLAYFATTVVPLYPPFGISVLQCWVDRATNQFVWTRRIEGASTVDEARAVTEAFSNSPERAAIADEVRSYIASVEARMLEPVELASPPAG